MSAAHYIQEFRANWREPSFWLEGPAFLWRHVLTRPLRRVGWAQRRRSGVEAVSIAEADWDSCIILDACRFDAFEQAATPAWDLERRLASGSDTGGFLRANYPPGASEPDTVYVNANPRVASEPTGEFHAMKHVWKHDWNDSYNTVMPGDVCDAARSAADSYPHKRLVVHLVQPHIPYIGDRAEKLPGGAGIQSMRPDGEMADSKPFAAVEAGRVEPAAIRAAYQESLELALDAVEALVEDLDGKTVVTADHGDLLGETGAKRYGEFSSWGHPANTPVPALVEVPWAVPAFDERKEIRAGSLTETNQTDPTREHLEALGYR